MTPRPLQPELAAAIADSLHEDDELNGGAVIGFVVVAEVMATSGERWLARRVGDGDGDSNRVTTWQIDGYLRHADSRRWSALDSPGELES